MHAAPGAASTFPAPASVSRACPVRPAQDRRVRTGRSGVSTWLPSARSGGRWGIGMHDRQSKGQVGLRGCAPAWAVRAARLLGVRDPNGYRWRRVPHQPEVTVRKQMENGMLESWSVPMQPFAFPGNAYITRGSACVSHFTKTIFFTEAQRRPAV